MNNNIHNLCGKWKLTFTEPFEEKRISAQADVPGNIEPVLAEMGLLMNYMPCDNLNAVTPFEAVDDWEYTTDFDGLSFDENTRKILVLEGVDTVAQVYLNGEKILDCMDMHLEYRYDITDRLKERNVLKVVIRSPELFSREHPHDLYSSTRNGCGIYDSMVNLRKARHQWGWDNAPRLITSGIIRPVYIEELPKERFDDVYMYTSQISEESVAVQLYYRYISEKKYTLDEEILFSLYDGEALVHTVKTGIFSTQGGVLVNIPREKIKLWYPRGLGEAKMYDVKLELLRRGKTVCSYSQPFGFRTIRLVRTDDVDDNGGEFTFFVNGESVFIRGANWKPLHPLASVADRLTKEETALNELVNLNCNMVRIWGGGIYEDTCLFDFCDRNGIMVWQDFMFACEITSREEWYLTLVKKEAEYVIKKYRNHVSLALWCGDNENDMCAIWVHGVANVLPSYNEVTRRVLKDAVLVCDPNRDYVESSPYYSDRVFLDLLNKKRRYFATERHFYENIDVYEKELKESREIFMGETGPIEINSFAVSRRIVENELSRLERIWNGRADLLKGARDLYQADAHLDFLLKNGLSLCRKLMNKDFSFEEYKDYMLAINLLSAEVFKDIIEYCRVSRPHKTGVIWWSLIDMWNMLCNYSVIDCDGGKKLGYTWIKQSQNTVLLACVSKEYGGDMSLYAINDSLDEAEIRYTVTAYDKAGNSTVVERGEVTLGKNSFKEIKRLENNGESRLLIIRWTCNGKEYYNHAFQNKYTDFDIMKKWLEIICDECNLRGEIAELQ